MKHQRIYLAIAVLVLATLACQTVMGGGTRDVEDAPSAAESITQPEDSQSTGPAAELPTEPPDPDDSSGDSASAVDTDFPMTEDAFNIVEVGDGSLIYYTKLSAEEAMEFYRNEYAAKGYTEREELTVSADGMFSMVFDGDPSGQGVVVQSVDLGDGNRTISIRLEDV